MSFFRLGLKKTLQIWRRRFWECLRCYPIWDAVLWLSWGILSVTMATRSRDAVFCVVAKDWFSPRSTVDVCRLTLVGVIYVKHTYCRCVPANIGRCHTCQTYVFNSWLFVSILSYMNFLYLQNVNHFIHVTPQKAFQICFDVPCNGWSCILLVYRSDIYRGRATINRISTVAHEYFDAFYDKHATSSRNCK